MSQRKTSSIDKHGGMHRLTAMATRRGVHLLQLRDDKGVDRVAASLSPFKIVC